MKVFLSVIVLFALVFPYKFSLNKSLLERTYVSAQVVKQKIINPQSVKGIIHNFIVKSDHLNDWRNGKVQYKHDLYDIDDSIVAYYYEIEKDNEVVGYFITGAYAEVEPILEYGEGSLDIINKEIASGNKAYYLGGINYLFAENKDELHTKFENGRKDLLNRLKNSESKDTNRIQGISQNGLKGLQKDKENIKVWEEYIEEGNKISLISTNTATAASYKVLPVDDISQRRSGITNQNSACGPTSGAMIIDYYHDHYGYNVRDNAYYGSWAKLVNHLYGEMNTNWYGTSMSEWIHGMYDHVTHDVHASAWGYNYMSASGNSYNYTNSIEKGNPVGLRFDRFKSSDSVWSEYHFVTGIGFDKNGSYSGDLHIAIKDPDDGTTATRWIDWTVNDQDLEMGYLY